MTPKQATEQAVRCFEQAENCAAGIWLDVAQGLIWDTLEEVIAEQQAQIAWAEAQVICLCWDCLFARRAIVALLEAAVEGK
jgi:hypothetical protein